MFQDFIYWAFLSMISGLAIYHVKVLNNLTTTIKGLTTNVAVLISKHDTQEKGIEENHNDIKKLKDVVAELRVSLAKFE